ncbi:GAF domain-containing protein [Dyella sp. Tek66A03]|uniref:GAF domain-containing protein n=1 Tax=Dyella sp. Tek66A03 TaxID=3458298 RepID=UPI00403EB5B1
MSSQNPTCEFAWPPSVVGFDMPSPSMTGCDSPGPAMIAFLSTRPDHYWIEAFVSQVGEFKSQNNLMDVRIDPRGLVVTGPTSQLRGLGLYVRSFVHRVSRISLEKRVIERLTPADGSAPDAAENAAANRDVGLVLHMPGVASILQEVSRVSGMRFVTIARVTDTRWTACAVYDTINFGLRPGQDLLLETTICNEIRTHGKTVMFSHASTHPLFSRHPTPPLYGFESYIALPIYRAHGQFFGTLCAVDPQPRHLDEATVKVLEKLARGVGEEIDRAASCAVL